MGEEGRRGGGRPDIMQTTRVSIYPIYRRVTVLGLRLCLVTKVVTEQFHTQTSLQEGKRATKSMSFQTHFMKVRKAELSETSYSSCPLRTKVDYQPHN